MKRVLGVTEINLETEFSQRSKPRDEPKKTERGDSVLPPRSYIRPAFGLRLFGVFGQHNRLSYLDIYNFFY